MMTIDEAPTADPSVALHRLVAAMGWTLERVGGAYTTVLPNGLDRTTYSDPTMALASTAYVCTWRPDRESVRDAVRWLGPASDLTEGLRGAGLRWLAGEVES